MIDPIPTALPLIKQFEAFRSHPYLDSAGIPTIGYGTTVYPDGTKVTLQDRCISEYQATEYLLHNMREKWSKMVLLFLEDPTPNQAAAMLSLTYNIGSKGFAESTVLRKFNARDLPGAADAFLMWDKVKKVVSEGLHKRREKERDLFSSQ